MIINSIWICSLHLFLYEIISRFHSRHVLLSHPTYPRIHLTRMQTRTGCMLNTHPLADDHRNNDVYVLQSVVFFSPSSSAPRLVCFYIFHLGAPHNQRAPRNTQGRRGARARAHKVARLVGAAAAALLRSPTVAPGARLPVVCQRLRVEFIQIKAVE